MCDTAALEFATMGLLMSPAEIDYRGNLAVWLRQEREARGLSMRKLADMLGVSYNAILNYEHARRFPEPEIMIDLAEIFGVPPDYLYKVAYNSFGDNEIASNEDARHMLDLFRRLPKSTRDLILVQVRAAVTAAQRGTDEQADTGQGGL